MELTNTQIAALTNVISGLTNPKEGEGKPLPFKVAYAMARSLAVLKPLAEATDTAVRHALTEYSGGKAGLEGDNPHYAEVMDNIAMINNTKVAVDLHRVKLSQLENMNLTPKQLHDLMPVIDDEGKE